MIRHDKLYAFIADVRLRPFAWGSWDCCQFTSAWIAELTGTDPRPLFPAYASEEEAAAILATRGGLIALVDGVLPRIHKSRAVEGDLVLSNEQSMAALGICLGVQSAHVGARGLEYLNTLDGLAAWRVA